MFKTSIRHDWRSAMRRVGSVRTAIAATLSLCLLFSLTARAGELKSARLATSQGQDRLIIDTSTPVEPETFMLDNPARIVIDLPNTRPGNTASLDSIRSDAIRDIRHGIRNGDDLRLVLDMKRALSGDEVELKSAHEGQRVILTLGAQDDSTSSTAATAPPDDLRDIVIAIDPGHGGKDAGAVAADGTREKNIVLPIARFIARDLNSQPGFRAFLTRSDDSFISLRGRVRKAREHNADFFVSVHANTVDSSKPRGTMVFALSRHGATSTMASWMARKENHASMLGNGGSLDLEGRSALMRRTLIDLSLEAKVNDSLEAGQDMLDAVSEVNPVYKSDVEQANFAVLRSPDIPSLLVETDFLSNPHGLARLESTQFRHQLADAISNGIEAHFRKTPPMGTLLAWRREHPDPIAEAAARNGDGHYRVKSGDTLSGIANRHDVSLQALRRANHLSRDSVLNVGESLTIPSA
ncbi:N-acetylmuramoyl-L-alanine amidase [Kushneria sinocarnis]|uniref:N-acetylmuramoyl-L-alanine amidase n=1 Tax=Kushneria sinocarnis TaxID=595502 RepID=UPI001474E124|nr:N-acetylmuramoyl-L-alanine amidase [Kushneria sinocarnis]